MNFRRFAKSIPTESERVLQYAVFLLSRRGYSRAELLEKMRGKFKDGEEIFEQVLTRLTELGLQSDEQFAADFVRSKPGWGAVRLSLELKKKGIADELIAKNLPEDSDEKERCRETLAAKLRGDDLPIDFKELQKLRAFLARRGFSLDLIGRCLDDFNS